MEQKALLYKTIWKSEHSLTVEPVVVIFCAAFMLSESLFQNFLLFQTCDKFNFQELRCDTELDSETATSELTMFRSSFLYFFWIFTISCVGSLIDGKIRYLRWFLLLPAAGQLMCDLLNFLNVIYFNWPPIVLVLSTLFLSGLTGSQLAVVLLSTTYVSHTSTIDNRSIKIGYVIFSQIFGLALGNVSSGYVLQLFGFGFGFLLCVLMNGFSLFLGFNFIEDLSDGDTWAEKPRPHSFITAVQDGFKIIIKERPYHRRTMIILVSIASLMSQIYQVGENAVLYLFLRNRFGWEASQYGVFMFYILSIKAAGTVIVTEIFKRRFLLRDATIGIIATVCEILSHCLWFVTFYTWQIYLVPVLGIFERVIQLISLSLASKCVAREEYGRLSSLFALTNLFIPITFIVYNLVYQSTLRDCPTAIFIISITLLIPLPFIYWCLLHYSWKIPKQELIRGET